MNYLQDPLHTRITALEDQLSRARKALQDHEEERELLRGVVARLEALEDDVTDLTELIRTEGIARSEYSAYKEESLDGYGYPND